MACSGGDPRTWTSCTPLWMTWTMTWASWTLRSWNFSSAGPTDADTIVPAPSAVWTSSALPLGIVMVMLQQYEPLRRFSLLWPVGF